MHKRRRVELRARRATQRRRGAVSNRACAGTSRPGGRGVGRLLMTLRDDAAHPGIAGRAPAAPAEPGSPEPGGVWSRWGAMATLSDHTPYGRAPPATAEPRSATRHPPLRFPSVPCPPPTPEDDRKRGEPPPAARLPGAGGAARPGHRGSEPAQSRDVADVRHRRWRPLVARRARRAAQRRRGPVTKRASAGALPSRGEPTSLSLGARSTTNAEQRAPARPRPLRRTARPAARRPRTPTARGRRATRARRP
ncbi:MAG: hypothetical protein QOG70_1393 [Solirubrobacteraceae bacterium]|nr:hypothetical protein [Solirubrobacteraceae bacterium]